MSDSHEQTGACGSDLTCQQVVGYLMAYLDGELAEAERSVFDMHLKLCPDCVCYLETYRATIRLGKAACTTNEPAPPIPRELVKAILAARKPDA
jgi:anti-sigma factor RsiW